jgi:DnaJ-class molecular chaperone
VKRDASQAEIQKAYRQLAKKLHPDLHPGNRKTEEQFKEVSAAYALLNDPDKRARFDRGEIDASGAERHPLFTREGDNIRVELPISLSEAVLGGKINVPTPTGRVSVRVPKWSNSGTVLRLKGKGVPRPDGSRGDEYVSLKIVLPDRPDPELERFVGQWRAANSFNPRQTAEA